MRKTALIVLCGLVIAGAALAAKPGDLHLRNPGPTGNTEANAPSQEARIDFGAVREEAGLITDLVAHFPKEAANAFFVEQVEVNGVACDEYIVRNHGAFHGGRIVNGEEDFSVGVYTGWEPGIEYQVALAGTSASGAPVAVTVSAAAPESRDPISGLRFVQPSAEKPYHHMAMTLAKESLEPGRLVSVEIDGQALYGKFCTDVCCSNTGTPDPRTIDKTEGLEGETHTGRIDGSRDFVVTAPCTWVNGSKHTMRITVEFDSGEQATFEREASAPGSGGYWNAAWPHYTSITLQETIGLLRKGEPIHLTLGFFADDITDPAREIRVVTYDPNHPDAGSDGYVIAPCQVTDVIEWRDEALLAAVEKDAETGEVVDRYDATTTVDLVFLADVLPYGERVYQIVYGNPDAEPPAFDSDLKVTQGDDPYAQAVRTDEYEFTMAAVSGAVETISVLGEGDPVLLEHRLETNGAVHWNPGCYSPPLPWVHVSDWETPALKQISGPVMHRTERYGPLPHMTTVSANVVYEFYAGKPYVLMSSLMEVQEEIFVKALRNSEIVFNHAVLDEFVWEDALGATKNMMVEGSKLHPIHALEIPADTPWWALVNREQGVGFASVAVDYENTNRYGALTSAAQPYFYVQNGPWIYVSRPIVYPFGSQNLTRVMRVRAGMMCFEKNAWVPFRFAPGDDPFAEIKQLADQLANPLKVHEWMPIDERTPEKWIMPILTMPFDEGVAGAVSAHKPVKGESE